MPERVVLQTGGYRAEFAPDYGGSCLSLTHIPTGARILRTPASDEELAASPLLFGTPPLIPPNRISGGRSVWRGREYVFPLNEPEHNNHCHGALYRMPAEKVRLTQNAVAFTWTSTQEKPYLGFIHPCRLEIAYGLDENGLSQCVAVTNDDDCAMPFAVAFHTAFNLTFAGGNGGDYALAVPAVREYLREMTHYIPTGAVDDDFAEKAALRSGTFIPAAQAITKFIEVDGNVCKLTHLPSGMSVLYQSDRCYRFRHIFNGGSQSFVCVEPQTCRIDGINVFGEAADNGILTVEPHRTLRLRSRIRLQERCDRE